MLLEIEGLTKAYRTGVRANDGIDLHVGAGQVYGLLGHNGAGKTTLVNQVVGLLKPNAGSIRVDGHDMVANPGLARRLCSVQAQSHVPIDGLTPRQAIDLLGQLRGGRREEVRARREALVAELDLGEWLNMDGARLSGGVKRLVAFAMAAVQPGRLVMLDEPTNDVDPVRRRLLWGAVRRLADEGAAVLLVTHNVIEAERSVDRLAILESGKVVAEGSPAELKAGLGAALRLELVLAGGDAAGAPAVPSPFGRPGARVGNRQIVPIPSDGAAAAVAWAESLQRAAVADEFTLGPATLEDVYVAVAESGESGAGGAGSARAAGPAGAAGSAGAAGAARAEELSDASAA